MIKVFWYKLFSFIYTTTHLVENYREKLW
jgi:hypothetical protein